MRRSDVPDYEALQNVMRNKRALQLYETFKEQRTHFSDRGGFGDYETWIMLLHLAFREFSEDMEGLLAPTEWRNDEQGNVMSVQKWPPSTIVGVRNRKLMVNAPLIQKLRSRYPRVWWVWDHALRTGQAYPYLPRPYLWRRGTAEIPADVSVAIYVHPDTTLKDVIRTWQSTIRLRSEVYVSDPFPRCRVKLPLKNWPDIVRACEEFHERGKYATVGRRFGVKADTVRAAYKKARQFVFCGLPVEYQRDEPADGADEIEQAIRPVKSRGVHRDPRATARKPRLTSHVEMTPEQRALEKQADVLIRQSNR